ncbi:MAG: ABC transporter substrate-binding protein [Betaproteobacteria bacterium]|nr:ABC transporter substrate-binding protein [Betaproteobacteria bacterium]
MNEPKPASPGRRKFTAGVAVATVAPTMFFIGKARAAEQVVVRTPGGVFDDVKKETIYDPFRKETGIEVVPVAATTAKLMAMMKSGQNELDLIDTGDSTLLELEKSNYLQAINYDEFKYTNPADIDPVVKRKYQVGCFIYAMVLGYNTKAIKPGSEPKSWAEFWDLKKFPGRRTLPDMASGTPSLEFALIADGVPMDKLYPLDIDRAFKSMSRIRSAIPKFWDTGALSSTMLADNEVAMGAIWSTRAAVAIDQGAPLGIMWNQNALLAQAYGIPVGAKNLANAKKFIDWSSTPEAQARWLAKYKAIPVNTKAYGATSKDLMDPATGTPWTRSKGFLLDINWWADNRQKVGQYWSKWIIS